MIGIDIGAQSLFISRATGADPAKYPVKQIHLRPGWQIELLQFIGSACTVVAEPTGWHYSAPVESLLREHGITFYQINHSASHRLRSVFLRQKTDTNDARALAKAAQMIEAGEQPRGVKPFMTLDTLPVRLALNKARRATKEATRSKNRIKVYAHAIDPTGQIEQLAHVEQHPLWPELHDEASRLPLFARQKAEAEQRAAEICWSKWPQVMARILTIPYSTTTRAAALLVASDGMIETMTQDSFVAAVGAAPRQSYSGSISKSRPDKKGYRPAVDTLHMWTMQLIGARNPNPVKTYYAGGEKKGGKKLNAAKTKLARLIWSISRDPAGCNWPNAKRLVTEETTNEADQ